MKGEDKVEANIKVKVKVEVKVEDYGRKPLAGKQFLIDRQLKING